MEDVRADRREREVARAAVPEQFLLLRSLQLAAHHWRDASADSQLY